MNKYLTHTKIYEIISLIILTVFDLYVHFAPEDNIYCGMLKNSDLPLAGQIWEND